MKPSVSIILPTLNHSNLLSDCLQSIKNQTFQDFEVIIVDDGSTDDTKGVINKFVEENNLAGKTRYFCQKHSGVSQARNFGILNSKSELIAFIDDDDTWDNRKLELQVKAMALHGGIAMSFTNLFLIYLNSKKKFLLSQKESITEGRIFKELLYKCFIFTSSVMARKDVLSSVGLFDKEMIVGEDWDLWLRIAYGHNIKYIKEPLVYYSMHNNNAHKNIDEMLRGHRRIINKVFYSNEFLEYQQYKTPAKLNFYLTAAEVYVRRRKFAPALKSLIFAIFFFRPKFFWGWRRICGVCWRFIFAEEFNS